jgi:hypothetical protein
MGMNSKRLMYLLRTAVPVPTSYLRLESASIRLIAYERDAKEYNLNIRLY